MDLQKEIKLAEEALKAERFEDAIIIYTKLLEIYPENANIYSERGVAYFHNKQNIKALEDMDKAVVLEPENSYRYSSRAYIKASLRMTDEAIADYKKCVELDPEDAIAHNNLGLLLEQKGWNKQAQDSFNKADTLEGVLKDRNITMPSEEVQEEEQATTVTLKEGIGLIKQVFTDKQVFKEFVGFIKNGLKLKGNSNKN